MWLSNRRAKVPFRLRLLRAEWTAALLGGLSLLLFIGSHLAS